MPILKTTLLQTALCLLSAALAPSVQAFNFDDLEKVEKVERGERKVREAKAEAARLEAARQEEARRHAQAQAEEAVRQRASSGGGGGSSGSSSRGRFDPSKLILVPDGDRYKLFCGSTYSGFVTFMRRNSLGQWSSTGVAGLRDSYAEAAYEAAKDTPNCQR